ncbi:MAG: glycogen/starch/alpha-glucan phosphorylase, partial [Oscillospiraceae bacterium]|nr:glycogen/starch/alpha-glucan phosphorylase [Oscillospiraceae bacterium]
MAAMKTSEIEKFKKAFVDNLQTKFSVSPDEASDRQVYQVLSAMVVDILKKKRQHFINQVHSAGKKQVYYLSMEFLMGRSLKTSLYNLEMADGVKKMLASFDIKIDKIFECEPDAGLGNGGLGRLAACYLDG